MFHNVLMTSLTALRNTDEVTDWQNRPFATIWPEDLQNQTPKSVYQPKSAEITKTIKKRTKRLRTAYTTDQLRLLERTFMRIRYIDAQKRKELAESLNVTEKSIKVWFQNRRMKEKRESESSDSSPEVTTTEMSPPPPLPISPVLETKVYPEVGLNQFNINQDSTDTSHYQLPDFHFFTNGEYQSVASAMPGTEPFANDRCAYPTYYYPTLEDYYLGESYQYDNGNMTGGEANWSATNFDLNYFQ